MPSLMLKKDVVDSGSSTTSSPLGSFHQSLLSRFCSVSFGPFGI